MFTTIFLFIIILILSFCIITAKNPVLAVVSLIIIYILISILFILIGAEFIGMLLLIVYVGAISVLFLFVIMMLNSRLLELYSSSVAYLLVGSFVIFIFLVEIYVFWTYDFNVFYYYLIDYKEYNVKVESVFVLIDLLFLGQLIMNHGFVYLFPAGLILLLGLIGAIALTFSLKSSEQEDEYIFLNKKKTK